MSAFRNFENNHRLCIAAARDAEKGQQTTQSQPEADHAQSPIAYAPQSLVFKATCVHTADAYH